MLIVAFWTMAKNLQDGISVAFDARFAANSVPKNATFARYDIFLNLKPLPWAVFGKPFGKPLGSLWATIGYILCCQAYFSARS